MVCSRIIFHYFNILPTPVGIVNITEKSTALLREQKKFRVQTVLRLKLRVNSGRFPSQPLPC
jgi:hypothetical protein